jgi:hypothetical protein
MVRAIVAASFGLLAALTSAQADVPGAIWRPAAPNNQTSSNRPVSYTLRYMVLHITEGSYSGAISWFQNETSDVSAHFVIRSSDGEVTQMVRIKDIAWHAGNSTYNREGIGFEHEGFVSSASWWTDAIYRASTNTARYLAKLHNIPRTRTNFVMHREVPGVTKSCPGPFFDPDYYLKLVMLHAEQGTVSAPATMFPGRPGSVTITMRNAGDLAWRTAAGSEQVTLATYPEGRASSFRFLGWQSAAVPAVVSANTNANHDGQFSFEIMSPMAFGTYDEQFQLKRGDGTRFGPIITVRLQVVGGTTTVVDNVNSGFSVTGNWATGTSAAGKFGADYRFRDTVVGGTDTASWFLNVPGSGWFDVQTYYPSGTNRSNVAAFRVEHGSGTTNVTVNQTLNGGAWVNLGRFRFNQGTGFVRLSNNAPTGKVVMADAVRAVSVWR